MQLILLEKVHNLGDLGDTVKVKAGYGRNFLLPQGKAVPATRSNLESFEARRAELQRAEGDKLAAAESRKEALEGVVLEIGANTSPEGKLYGSIGARELARELSDRGYPVAKSEVIMGEGPIRRPGEYEIPLQLHADVDTVVKVVVRAEET
mgnify:CR=1 FL=1